MLGNAPEPIAIVGMACRFAGDIDSLNSFWQLLCEGRDTIGELPPGRWDWYASRSPADAAAMRGVTRRGAFLSDVKGFDADFFDITPREAALMDPQQRIVLELAWEALEHAGIPPHHLAGSDAGVFIGVGADDYGRRLLEDLPRIEAWTGIGGAYCAVANRVSYVLDLRGPSIAVDTACSSSLVAIHLAAQALRAGECAVALAGGVLVMAAPGLSLVLDAAGATASDGRSKSFDAKADGYGRGEGGGVVVLKRLADARRAGDRILAVVRGSAVHQDGRTNGIMAPSGPAQAHLMRRAYADAGIDPSTVDYVEAHGTGTRAGDPLEAGAIAEVLGRTRPAGRPLLIGSVKPNIGHLEAGAGVAGLIKTVLALRYGQIPPSINVTTPNPAIPWDTAGLRVVTETTPWPDHGDGPRRAGVSGYGYGGTIAHVIVEQAEEAASVSNPDRPGLYPLSGAGDRAVMQLAQRLADRLARDATIGLTDVGHTLARRRTHLASRAAVYAADRTQLIARLREYAATGTTAATGRVLPEAGLGVVWVFSGHGSQWAGMARQLLTADPAFAAVIDRLEPVFLAELGWSPRRMLGADGPHPVDVVQPLIFAVQMGLHAVWRAAGLRPAAVIGHSVGEIAAAVAAGMLRFDDGARLVCRRSALLRQVAGKGAMVMVNLAAEEAERRLGGRTDVTVAVAASPRSSVLSGDVTAVQELTERWRTDGLTVRPVASDVAFHSPHMDPITGALAAAAAGLSPSPARLPVYSTVLRDPCCETPRDGAYWAANLRRPVRFAQAVTAAAKDGYRLFLEVSPHPVVEQSLNETLESLGVDDAYVTHSLRRHQPERETLYLNLGRLHCHGADVDWSAMWPGGALADLPTTVWQRQPHWAPEPVARNAIAPHDPAGHTLLGGWTSVAATSPIQVWQTVLDRHSRPYPGDHQILGTETVPAAVVLNTLLAAAADSGITDVLLRVPISVTHAREVQVIRQGGALRLASRITGEQPDEQGWVTHATAAVTPDRFVSGRWAQAPDGRGEPLPNEFVVDRLAAVGVAGMGLVWTVEQIRRWEGLLRLVIRVGDQPVNWAPLLDAALSAASVALPGRAALRMPAHIGRVTLRPDPPVRAIVDVRVTGDDTVDLLLSDMDGHRLGRLAGVRYAALEPGADGTTGPRSLVHGIDWRPVRGTRERHPFSGVALVGPAGALRDSLAQRLGRKSFPVHTFATPEELPERGFGNDTAVLVVPPSEVDGEGVADTALAGAWLLTRAAQWLANTRAAPLWCVTQGVRDAADPAALGQAALWGLGRIIGGEHPEFWGGTVDIGPSGQDIDGLLDVIGTVRGEDVVSVRDGAPAVPRLTRVAGEPVRPAMGCRPDATYLITGGLGALGLEVAHWLAERGMRRVVLAGRRGLPPRDTWDSLTDRTVLSQVAAVRSLERQGVTVVPVAVDVTDPDMVARQLSVAAPGLPPIRGVVHAAGVLDNRTVRALDEESLRRVLRPKVAGALALHRLFPPGSVDFFVLFSSCGQLLGLPGQASYAAGNAFLDALAAHRRRAGDTGTISLGWTSWRGLGMSTSSEVIDAELAARGVADIGRAEAFQAWEFAERHGLQYAAVLRTLPQEPGERRLPLLSELPAGERPATSEAVAWADLTGADLSAFLAEEVGRKVAAETGLTAGEVDPRRPLVEIGVDSVMTVRIRRALERTFRQQIPATLLWDRPTVNAIAGWLGEQIEGSTK
ncbi:type I polyketide synthase [Allorhizocola rhizosphaerae]|uniref:type I polyketide synthase n=1 Tax=Allorhizocola rhizosphaerae TaxID=1872709 RepID=UPI000E3C5BBE|nr:type I polyketide synthase [Allorhizocola rhizosphaerae]